MKVRDLIARLQEMDPELPVCTWVEWTICAPVEVDETEVVVEDGGYCALPVSHDHEMTSGRYVRIG